MPRQRMIRPELWGDEGFLELSLGARLLFIGLISNADDEGRGVAAARSLKARIFPADSFTPDIVDGFKIEVGKNTRTIFYEVQGVQYYQLEKWRDYQKVDHPSPSVLPIPGTFPEHSPNDTGTIPDASRQLTNQLTNEGESAPIKARALSGEEKEPIEIEEAGGPAPFEGAGPPLPCDPKTEWEKRVEELGLTGLRSDSKPNDFSTIGRGPFG